MERELWLVGYLQKFSFRFSIQLDYDLLHLYPRLYVTRLIHYSIHSLQRTPTFRRLYLNMIPHLVES